MNFFKAMKSYFINMFNFSGRASRTEYWYPFLFFILLFFSMIYFLPFNLAEKIINIIKILIFIPNISLTVRRMHDTDHSFAYMFVPLYNFILLVSEGTAFENDYGDNPLDSW